MVLLQHKLSVKLSQRQILTPGLVQMVSVLALNKLELKDMINTEMVENPVLEELEDSVPLIDEVAHKEEERERVTAAEDAPATGEEKKDSFEEIDFGSFFKDYLDPGFRSPSEFEEIERPSFENFLSKPSTLTDHLIWQLGSIPTRPDVREAAELVIGNLNEDGYLIATDEELLGTAPPATPESDAAKAEDLVAQASALGLNDLQEETSPEAESGGISQDADIAELAVSADSLASDWNASSTSGLEAAAVAPAPQASPTAPIEIAATSAPRVPIKSNFDVKALHEAIEIVRQLDPPGVACRDLRECLLYQLRFHQRNLEHHKNGNGESTAQAIADAITIVDQHLRGLQLKQLKEIAKSLSCPIEAVMAAVEFIKTLDPRPGLRYNT